MNIKLCLSTQPRVRQTIIAKLHKSLISREFALDNLDTPFTLVFCANFDISSLTIILSIINCL